MALYHDQWQDLCQEVSAALDKDEAVAQLVDATYDGVGKQAGDKLLQKMRTEAVGVCGAALPPSTRRQIEVNLIEVRRCSSLR